MSESKEEKEDVATQQSIPASDQEDVATQQSIPASNKEQKQPLSRRERTDRWFQVITAIMLGLVAVATAWSGYQATRWAGEQSTLYAQASALRVESTRNSTLAGQYKLYGSIAVN